MEKDLRPYFQQLAEQSLEQSKVRNQFTPAEENLPLAEKLQRIYGKQTVNNSLQNSQRRKQK